uniref:Uncharacterized protein n=1 Tax=Sphaerodactylus townsendi TaxID=933632 RepID=A0ACB8F828_9SAUR
MPGSVSPDGGPDCQPPGPSLLSSDPDGQQLLAGSSEPIAVEAVGSRPPTCSAQTSLAISRGQREAWGQPGPRLVPGCLSEGPLLFSSTEQRTELFAAPTVTFG